MNEFFLHYVWQYQKMRTSELITTQGQVLRVIRPGWSNPHAGPDFLEAHLVIDELEWVGHVEIHFSSSDWSAHQHTNDPAYDSVILHVVWEQKKEIAYKNGIPIPTLELKSITPLELVGRYISLTTNPTSISCQGSWSSVDSVYKQQAIDRACIARLEKKVEEITLLFQVSENNWEQTAYRWWGSAFGFKLNKSSFLHLTEVIPLAVLQKQRGNVGQTEATLFGMAGLLPTIDVAEQSEYARYIKEEFAFIQRKFSWSERKMEAVSWQYARTRPGNFPTIRLAQFAQFIQKTPHISSQTLAIKSIDEAIHWLSVEQSSYWQNQYTWEQPAKKRMQGMGQDSIFLLIINAIVPYQFFYGQYFDLPEVMDNALHLLSLLPSETNSIIQKWKELDVKPKDAYESQGMIGLYTQFCQAKKCLECPVGQHIIQKV
ncbi:MAG: DUF2851 family protein [Spirosomataceae bacterium]